MLSHPSRKNKGAARMGHPSVVLGEGRERQPQVLRLVRSSGLAQDDKRNAGPSASLNASLRMTPLFERSDGGCGSVLSHPSQAKIHPTDGDLSVGTGREGMPTVLSPLRGQGIYMGAKSPGLRRGATVFCPLRGLVWQGLREARYREADPSAALKNASLGMTLLC